MFVIFSNNLSKVEQLHKNFEHEPFEAQIELEQQRVVYLYLAPHISQVQYNYSNSINSCENQAKKREVAIQQYIYYPDIKRQDYLTYLQKYTEILDKQYQNQDKITILLDSINKNKCDFTFSKRKYPILQVDNNFQFLNQISNQILSNTKNDTNLTINQPKLNQVLIIGSLGVGKTRIFKSFNGQNKNSMINQKIQESEQQFQQKIVDEKFILVDTPEFYFDEIQSRNLMLQKFTQYFEKNSEFISGFLIVIKYDRTDLMLKALTQILKYFIKICNNIIVIVDCDQEQVTNQMEIIQKIQTISQFKSIEIFFFSNNQLNQEFTQKILKLAAQKPKISIKDTIFELQANEEDITQYDDKHKNIDKQTKENSGFNNNKNIHFSKYYQNDVKKETESEKLSNYSNQNQIINPPSQFEESKTNLNIKTEYLIQQQQNQGLYNKQIDTKKSEKQQTYPLQEEIQMKSSNDSIQIQKNNLNTQSQNLINQQQHNQVKEQLNTQCILQKAYQELNFLCEAEQFKTSKNYKESMKNINSASKIIQMLNQYISVHSSLSQQNDEEQTNKPK